MKTLSEHEKGAKSDHDRWWEQRLERERKWLGEIEAKDIPLYEETDSRSTYRGEKIAKMRAGMRELIREGNAPRQGVACDHCGTELIDREGTITCSDPPKIYVGCPGCGWIGYKTA